MNTQKEWIENILDSASQIKEVEPNSYLLQKFKTQLQNNQPHILSFQTKLKWAVAATIILAVNFTGVYVYQHKQKINREIAEYPADYIITTNYNY